MIICLWSLQADATINEFSQGKSTLPNDAAKYFQLEEYGHKLKSIYISRLSWHWLENSQKHLSISLSLSLSKETVKKNFDFGISQNKTDLFQIVRKYFQIYFGKSSGVLFWICKVYSSMDKIFFTFETKFWSDFLDQSQSFCLYCHLLPLLYES